MSDLIICPACGGHNPHDAIFCGNTSCHKALGGFRYVAEEVATASRWFERLADRVTRFVGTPHFLLIHAVWFALWIVPQAAGLTDFDTFPFNLLAIILAIEAIFITGLLLVGGNRQAQRNQILGELDYQVSVTTYRKLTELEATLQTLAQRLERLEFMARERRDR